MKKVAGGSLCNRAIKMGKKTKQKTKTKTKNKNKHKKKKKIKTKTKNKQKKKKERQKKDSVHPKSIYIIRQCYQSLN